MRHARKPDAAARPAAVSRRDKPSNYPGGRQSALTALERHEIGLLRSVGGHASSILQIAEQMGRTLGQTVIVDNTTGAAGTIGVARVVRAVPDATRSASATGARTSSMGRSTRSATTS